MKLRQMDKLNSAQSFGRESNDLNVLAQLETIAEKSLPRQREGVLSWGRRRESEVRAATVEQNVRRQREKAGREQQLRRKGEEAWAHWCKSHHLFVLGFLGFQERSLS